MKGDGVVKKKESLKRRKKRHAAKYVPVTIFLMTLALIIGLSAFFRISEIEVTGISLYSPDEIISESGIEIGDNLLFISGSSTAVKICKDLVYVDEVRIIKNLPNKLQIEISESYPIASIKIDDSYWIIDKNCRLLEETDFAGAENTITIKGVTPVSPVAGQKISLGDFSETQLVYLSRVLTELLEQNIQDKVTWIDMSNLSEITFDYDGRFTVELGRGENVDSKFVLFIEVVAKLENTDTGTIDLSTDDKAYFIPA